MKEKYITLVLILLMVSCSKDIDVVNYVDSTKPFKIVQLTESIELGKRNEIKVNEKKHEQLLKWLELNDGVWESTSASYHAELIISQEDFKISFLKDMKSVALNFIDEKGEPRQFKKSVNPEKLKFLIE